MEMINKIKREANHWRSHLKANSTDYISRICSEWGKIFESSSTGLLLSPTAKKVLFVTGPVGLNPNALAVESFLIKLMQVRGHECISLACNSGVPSCEFNIYGSGDNSIDKFSYALSRSANSHNCQACTSSVHRVMRFIGCQYLDLVDYAKDEDLAKFWKMVELLPLEDIRDYSYRGIRVGEHAFSSTARVTLRGDVDFSNPYTVWVYRKQLLSSILMVDRFNLMINFIQPDKVVMVHGVYLFHGTAVDICAQRGIDVVVYGITYRKDTLLFSHNETYHRSLVNEDADPWEATELNLEMNRRLDEYLNSKTAGGRDNVNYHPNPIEDITSFLMATNIDRSKPVISMFTNVIWDAQIYYNGNVFKDIFDWIYSTIEYFNQRPDLNLVIRIHPAESKGGFVTKQPIETEIRSRFPNLPSNVYIISSESNLSSYTLAKMSEASLIYGTKMALEIAILGVPVIVSGECLSRGKGFTYDVETREQYIEYLENLHNLPKNDERIIDRARKFAYYYFFKRMIDMPFLNIEFGNISKQKDFYNFSNLKSLKEGVDKGLDLIVNGIIHKNPFH